MQSTSIPDRSPKIPSDAAATASAAGGQWFVVAVLASGPIENGGSFILLSDTGGKFNNVWYYVPPQLSTQFVEASLAAITYNKKAYVEVTGTSGGNLLRFHTLA